MGARLGAHGKIHPSIYPQTATIQYNSEITLKFRIFARFAKLMKRSRTLL